MKTSSTMLQKISNKSVRGGHFMITVPDIHKVEYTEAGRVTSVAIEGGMSEAGKVDWVIYAQTMRGWLPPHEFDEMSAEKRHEILNNVSQALSILGMPNAIEP